MFSIIAGSGEVKRENPLNPVVFILEMHYNKVHDSPSGGRGMDWDAGTAGAGEFMNGGVHYEIIRRRRLSDKRP